MPQRAGAIEALKQELSADPPASIAGLNAEQLDTLARALKAARAQQTVALQQAMDSGLGFVPRIVRGAVKKVLFG